VDDDYPELLFSTLDTSQQIVTPENLKLLSESQLVHDVLGYPCIMYVHRGSLPHPVIRIAGDIGDDVISRIHTSRMGEYVYILNRDSARKFHPYEVYEECPLPHKYIIGCNGCAELPAYDMPRLCAIRRYLHDGYSTPDYDGADVDELNGEVLQSSVTKIGPFTYISPMLTKPEGWDRETVFAKLKRPLDAHDFSVVAENSHRTSDAAVERNRVNRFRREVCPTCLVHAGCLCYAERWQIARCAGAFAQTEDEAAEEVLSKVHIPFNDAQLRYLLANSGELSERFDRHICVGSFYIDYDWRTHKNILRFGLRYRTANSNNIDVAFSSFKEAKHVLSEYGYDRSWPEWRGRMTKKRKALLACAAHIDRSPYKQCGWVKTSYSILTMVPSYGDAIELHFNWGGRRPLAWTATVQSFSDFYKHWREVPYLHR